MPRSKFSKKGNGSPDSFGDFDSIARRAYEIYQGRGASDGADLDDWLEAERQIRERQTGLTGRPAPAKRRRRKGTEEPGL
jgi:hypothetical protein